MMLFYGTWQCLSYFLMHGVRKQNTLRNSVRDLSLHFPKSMVNVTWANAHVPYNFRMPWFNVIRREHGQRYKTKPTTCTWWRNIYFLDNFRFLHMSSTITSSKSLLCQRQMWFEYVVFGVSYHIASSIGSNVSIECFMNGTWSLTINMITKVWIYFLFAVLNLKQSPYPVTDRRVFGWSNQKSLESWLFISREMPLIFRPLLVTNMAWVYSPQPTFNFCLVKLSSGIFCQFHFRHSITDIF